MSTPHGQIRLTGEQTYNNSQVNISANYTKAEVPQSSTRSLWVVYTVTEWDHKHPGDRSNVQKIVCTGENVTMDDPIKSLQGFDESNPGVILFEHSHYRGYGKLFQNTTRDITQYFDQGKISGVSSIIITGGKWSFYTGYNCRGTKLNIDGKTALGPGRYDLGNHPGNDQIKSIEYVQASD